MLLIHCCPGFEFPWWYLCNIVLFPPYPLTTFFSMHYVLCRISSNSMVYLLHWCRRSFFFPFWIASFCFWDNSPCIDLRSTSGLVSSEGSELAFCMLPTYMHCFLPKYFLKFIVSHVPVAQIRVSAAFITSLMYYSNYNIV